MSGIVDFFYSEKFIPRTEIEEFLVKYLLPSSLFPFFAYLSHSYFYSPSTGIGWMSYFFIPFYFVGTYIYSVSSSKLLSAPYFFLFQCMCFLGLAYEMNSPTFLYSSFLPCVVGSYFFMTRNGSIKAWELFRGGALAGCVFALALSLKPFYSNDYTFVSNSSLELFHFFLFGAFLIIIFSNIYDTHLNLFFKKDFLKHSDYETRDKIFAHDLINCTHGLNLYLSHKIFKEEDLSTTELNSIKSEIANMQLLIKDHFKMDHKNIKSIGGWSTLSEIEKRIGHLAETYNLYGPSVVIKFSAKFRSTEWEIHTPTFERIMNNLFKNIYEAQSENIDINFDINMHIGKNPMLIVRTSNDLKKLDVNSSGLSQELAKQILSEESPEVFEIGNKTNIFDREKLGLTSMQVLASQNGGEYKFWIQDNCWINELSLALRENTSIKSSVLLKDVA